MGGVLCPEAGFREADTRGADTYNVKDTKMLKRLNEVEAFEFTFPFYRMRIDKYEGCVKRFVNISDENTVTLRQLRYAFQEDESWGQLLDETSVLFRMFNQAELKDANQPDKLNVLKLLCIGLMLCGGNPDLKARVFYDILQDNMQQKISSSDKDFTTTFRNMIEIDCYMMMRMYRQESNSVQMNSHWPQPGTTEFENKLDEFKESFLDEVFGD